MNPFLDPSPAIRWSQLTPDLVEPAVETAIREAEQALDAVRALAPGEATYWNTCVAIEQAGEPVNRVWGRVMHLDSVCNNPALRDAIRICLPRVTEFATKITLDPAIWRNIKAAAAMPATATLPPVRRRHMEETVKDFVQSGADLPSEGKSRLQALEMELATITQQFSENVLDSTNAWELVIDDPARLAGLPDLFREQARESAARKGLGTPESPRWRLTLHQPSLGPALKYIDDPALRRQLFLAAANVGLEGGHDNTALISRILRLRHEKADLLGFSNFPDLVLSRRMAGTGRCALDFVEDMHVRIVGHFQKDCDELAAFKGRISGNEVLEPWDIAYYSEKLRVERYDFDEEALRPYFPMASVVDGMFRICETLFGLRIVEVPSCYVEPGAKAAAPAGAIETWHPEVRVYEVRNADGSLQGTFYTDWHPRESKRGGAWMNYLETGTPLADGTWSPHLGLMVGNMTPPSADKPALLDHREVETVFHEFGHLLHHLLGRVEVKSLSGTNVAWDFVELPSQIMENWCWNREALDRFARHHETGATLPGDLFDKMVKARNFQAAIAAVRQLSLGKMDLELHLNHADTPPDDLDAFLHELLAAYRIPTKTSAPSIVRRFTHIFGSSTGYAAAYYSYKWAEVLDADAFTRFEQEGIMNPSTGMAFRNCILSKGNSEPADKLFRDFMGRDPDSGALLRRSGLA